MVVLTWAIRIGLALLFAYAGVLKLGAPAQFATDIANYRFFPSLAPWIAVCMPTTELTVAVALLFGRALWLRAAALASIALFAIFTVAVGHAYFHHINVSCGCFGSESSTISIFTLVRNCTLVAASAIVFWFPKKS